MSVKVYDNFLVRNEEIFCNVFFKIYSSYDVVDNNMAEIFNCLILLVRFKYIVSMFEDIRLVLMERMRVKKGLVKQFIDGVVFRISQKFIMNKQYMSVGGIDKIMSMGLRYCIVGCYILYFMDLEKKICSCRIWDFTGVFCFYVMSNIFYMN